MMMSMEKDSAFYMREALKEAESALEEGEVPVGAVVVRNGEIIARSHNHRENDLDISSHAEINALKLAAKTLGRWDLSDCSLYVTLEPCLMCAGAILNARIARVWYGARDETFGACGGVSNLFMEDFPNRPALVGGILGEECRQVLSDFFSGLRQGKSDSKK